MNHDLIQYDPARTPGETRQSASGETVRFVEPAEYYVALLGNVMNATVVFLNAGMEGKMDPDTLSEVDEAIADAFWNEYEGCLTPPRVLRSIQRAATGPSGKIMVEDLDDVRQQLFDAENLEEAAEIHADARLQFLMRGAERYLTDTQVAVGEVTTDYLLLQRAIAEDIRRAERERDPGQPRASVLERLDRSAELMFEEMLSQVLRPQRIVDLIPQGRREDIASFARRRRPIFRTGVFADPPAGASGEGGPPPAFGGDDW